MGFDQHDTGLWVPELSDTAQVVSGPVNVTIDNQTDLPDAALLDHFETNASAFGFGSSASFRSYQQQGSMFARSKTWQPPSTPIEEIVVARDLAQRDDDVAPTLDMLTAAAFADGYQNQHSDAQVQELFDEMTADRGLGGALKEMYREWLIAGQVTTATVLTRQSYDIRPEGVTRVLSRSVGAPNIGVLPAEQIRVVGNDLIGQGRLAFAPLGPLADWLREFFGTGISAARRFEMATADPVSASMFVGRVPDTAQLYDSYSESYDRRILSMSSELYYLNPEMCHRSTMPKGSWKYPRPPMTRNLPLLEAKRLLNVMDFALLQGGTNFIIVARKGTDQRPALPQEILNLREQIKRASHSGVIIGDHRLQIDVVTPDLGELLNPDKRRMIGRKLAMAMLRAPDVQWGDKGSADSFFATSVERVATSDRNDLADHIKRFIWPRVMKRNAGMFNRTEVPDLWFPKIMLVGQDWFTDYLLKMYDRGDLPRKYMVEFGGFNYEAAMAQKQREGENGHDDIFQPPAVPFSSPDNAPNDNGGGRPRGSGPDNGAPGARTRDPAPSGRPSRVVRRTRGDTVRAFFSEEANCVVRVGSLTEALLEEYPDATQGRMTANEQEAVSTMETVQRGPVVIVPVNAEEDLLDHRVMRLADGLSAVVGYRRRDSALMVRALCFREPEWDIAAGEDLAVRFGFEVALSEPEPEPAAA